MFLLVSDAHGCFVGGQVILLCSQGRISTENKFYIIMALTRCNPLLLMATIRYIGWQHIQVVMHVKTKLKVLTTNLYCDNNRIFTHYRDIFRPQAVDYDEILYK